MIREIKRTVQSGYLALVVLTVLQLGFGYMVYLAIRDQAIGSLVAWLLLSIVVLICWAGLFMVHPNEAKVLQLFGKYAGTCHDPGLRWANPFYTKKAVSVRVRNFESGKLKVNDSNGSPIEIAAVVVWKVFDTAEALFEVDDYVNFVQIQSEAALRTSARPIPTSRMRTRAGWRCAATPSRSRRHFARKSRSGCRRPVSRSSKRAFRISPMRRKSPQPC